jgi:TRAP-type C4-dicarboxylate transport system permease small subunit
MNAAHGLRRVSDGLNRIVIFVTVSLVVVMLTTSTLGIVFEVIFNLFELFDAEESFRDSPLAWLYSQTRPSMTRLFLPWVAMLSVTVGFKTGEHVAIAMLVRKLKAPALTVVRAVNYAVVAIFGALLVWFGIGFFENATQYFMVSDTLQISHKWTNIVVPICGAIMCVHLLSGLSLVELAEFGAEEPEETA